MEEEMERYKQKNNLLGDSQTGLDNADASQEIVRYCQSQYNWREEGKSINVSGGLLSRGKIYLLMVIMLPFFLFTSVQIEDRVGESRRGVQRKS